MGAASLGVLTLDLVAQIGNYIQPLQQAEQQTAESISRIEERASSASDGIKDMFLGVAAAYSAGALFDRFIEESKSAQAEQAQLAAVLKSTNQAAGLSIDQLNDMADAMSKASIFGGGDINQAQTSLLAFTGIVGDQFPRAMQAAIDMAARTGMSVVSAAETVGRALDVPSQGMGALSKQGFKFTEDQKELAKQLEATGKTAEAQGIILEALESSYSGAALAARNTFDGSLKALDETIGGLLTNDKGIGALTLGINTLNDVLSSDGVAKGIDLVTKASVLLAAAIGGRLVGSTVASALTFIEAQREALRYQATLASMAGVSQTAAVSQAALGGAVRGALALTGGWVGLIATAAILAGGFLLLRDNSDAASASFDDQSKSVADLAKEYIKLDEAQQRVILREQADKVDSLTAAYAEQREKLALVVGSFSELANAQDKATFIKLAQDYYDQKINATQLADSVNQLASATEYQKSAVDKQAVATVGAANALQRAQQVMDSYAAANAAGQHAVDGATAAIAGQGAAAAKAAGQLAGLSEKAQDFFDQQKKSAWNSEFAAAYAKKNNLPTDFGGMVATAVQNNDGKLLSQQQTNELYQIYQQQQAVKDLNEARNKAAKDALDGSKKLQDANKKQQDSLQHSYKSVVEGMQQQIALYGKSSEAAKIAYEVQSGKFAKLGSEQKAVLIDLAKQMDAQALLPKADEVRKRYTDEKKAMLDKLQVASQLTEQGRKQAELAQQYHDFTMGQQAELIIYSKRVDYANDYFNLLERSKTAEQKALEETQQNVAAVNYMFQSGKTDIDQYGKALKDAFKLGSTDLPKYESPYELSGAQGELQKIAKNRLELAKAFGNQSSLLDRGRDAAVNAAEQGAINSPVADLEALNSQLQQAEQQHNDAMLDLRKQLAERTAALDSAEKDARLTIFNDQLGAASNFFGGLADLAEASGGKQSKTFKRLFEAQKVFSIASSLVSTYKAAADAWADPSAVTIYQKVAGAAFAIASTTALTSALRSVAAPDGQAHDGIDSVPADGTWLLKQGERVSTAKTSAKLDRTLDDIQRRQTSGPQVTVNNYVAGADASARVNADGSVTVDIVDQRIAALAAKAVANDVANPNGVVNKSLKRQFNMTPNRN